jgi:hypothetical protein
MCNVFTYTDALDSGLQLEQVEVSWVKRLLNMKEREWE